MGDPARGDGAPVPSPRSSDPAPTSWWDRGAGVTLLGPVTALSVTPKAVVVAVGAAAPLAFAVATLAALIVAHSLFRLGRRQPQGRSASLPDLVAASLGTRTGVATAWVQVAGYTCYAVAAASAAARFALSVVHGAGLWRGPPDGVALLLVGLTLATAFAVVAFPGVGLGAGLGRAFRVLEVAVAVLLLGVAVLVLIRGAGGDPVSAGPALTNGTVRLDLPQGSEVLLLGAVLAFPALAGLEVANPQQRRRNWAGPGRLLLVGGYAVVITWAMVAEHGAVTPDDMAARSVAPWLGHVVAVAVALCATKVAATCTDAAACALSSLAGRGSAPPSMGRRSTTRQTPVVAALVIVECGYVLALALWALARPSSGTASAAVLLAATLTGTLLLIVTYLLVLLGGIRRLFLALDRTLPAWEVVLPTVGIVVLGGGVLGVALRRPPGVPVVPVVVTGAVLASAALLALRPTRAAPGWEEPDGRGAAKDVGRGP